MTINTKYNIYDKVWIIWNEYMVSKLNKEPICECVEIREMTIEVLKDRKPVVSYVFFSNMYRATLSAPEKRLYSTKEETL